MFAAVTSANLQMMWAQQIRKIELTDFGSLSYLWEAKHIYFQCFLSR